MQEKIGRYEIRRELGRGGMATVYLGFDPRFDRQVAIKVLPRQFMHDPRFLTRFQQEAKIIAALEHPAIVPVYDYGESDDAPYLVMRYMPGGSLRDRLAGGRPSLEQIAAILEHLAPALDKAHAAGIIHRDLKPSNILYDDDGQPYLADFGIARIAEASRTVDLVGTPAYMSPEQAQGSLEPDGRSDIYALGVILYELFTGDQPYTGDTPIKQITAHILEPIPDVLASNPDLPPAAHDIINTTMAKDREDRFSTVGELAVAARALANSADQPPVADAVSAQQPQQTDETREPEEIAVPSADSLESEPEVPDDVLTAAEVTDEPEAPSAESDIPVPQPIEAGGQAGLFSRIGPWLGVLALIMVIGYILYQNNPFIGPNSQSEPQMNLSESPENEQAGETESPASMVGISSPTADAESSTATVRGPSPSTMVASDEFSAENESVPASESAKVTGQVETITGWDSPNDESAKQALFDIFRMRNPEVEIFDSTIGNLVSRMEEGDPPDSFRVHAGHELIDTWVHDGAVEPVTFIFDNNDWRRSYPQHLIEALTEDGEIWAVPIDVHRANVLWYNKDVFEEYELQAPETIAGFFAVAEVLQAAGITPLAQSDGVWSADFLLENVLLGTLGADGYEGLWTGETDWNSPEVTQALNNFARMMSYTNEDRESTAWTEAADRVANGQAGMYIMGDWVHGYFKNQGLVADEDYGWVPSPGTDGTFMLLSDVLTLPQGAHNREAAVAWLELVGSKEGQDVFNPLKGSIPARNDGDGSLYDNYQRSTILHFNVHTNVPYITHAATPLWLIAINEAEVDFLFDGDIEALQDRLATACFEVGECR